MDGSDSCRKVELGAVRESNGTGSQIANSSTDFGSVNALP